jgi:poly(A) polymerase
MSRENAENIVRVLQGAGHEAVLAGGCVRDRLLGIEPADHDVATSAVPEQIESLFKKTVPVGRRFGVIIVNDGDAPVEVATFRADGDYKDGRHPETVRFSGIEEDARRRDFTINAMFEDPVSGRIIDLVGGREDLAAGLVRAVGDPTVRFGEDRLRILRAARFAARFDFRIDDGTAAAMRADADRLTEVSAERVGDEIAKILTDGRARRGFELLDETGLLEVVLPEMIEMKGCEQSSDHHPEGDVFVHTLACLGHLPRGCTLTLALGVLLHDIAKPRCAALRDGRHTFHGHTHMGAEMAADICRRLRYGNAVIDQVVFLVDQHLRHCSAPDMKASTLKRFLRQDGIEELLELTRIDALGSSGDLTHYRFCTEKLAGLPPEVMRPPRLLTGRDLIDLGLAPGPEFRDLLRLVEDAQLDGRISSREEAVELVRSASERLQVGK